MGGVASSQRRSLGEWQEGTRCGWLAWEWQSMMSSAETKPPTILMQGRERLSGPQAKHLGLTPAR